MNDFEGNIAVSKTCARPFSDWFKCHFEVIPNGVPIDEFTTGAPRIPKFDDGKTNLFFMKNATLIFLNSILLTII
jgi:hypothetical protein